MNLPQEVVDPAPWETGALTLESRKPVLSSRFSVLRKTLITENREPGTENCLLVFLRRSLAQIHAGEQHENIGLH